MEIDPNNWILKKTQGILLTPYANDVSVNTAYQKPGSDTLVIKSGTENPENHDVELEAIIESSDLILSNTIPLFDDGLHNDGETGDGIFAVSWPVPSGEKSYNVHIKTISLESGYSNLLQNAAYFTTTGPIVLDDVKIISEDTIANPNDRIAYEFTLRNEGVVETVRNVTSKTISLDTCAVIFPKLDPLYGDIGAGESSVASRHIFLYFAGR